MGQGAWRRETGEGRPAIGKNMPWLNGLNVAIVAVVKRVDVLDRSDKW
jgi:hypothetical protein